VKPFTRFLFQTPLTIHDVNIVKEEQGVAPTTTDSNEKCSDQEISEVVSIELDYQWVNHLVVKAKDSLEKMKKSFPGSKRRKKKFSPS
jgi:hypothetical protein